MFEMDFLGKLSKSVSVKEAISLVDEHVSNKTMMEVEEERKMDTLGNLVDKLTTVNAKLWHNQEELYKIRKMTVSEFEVIHGKDMKGLHGLLARCCDLNVQRAKLMDEIDKFLSMATGHEGIIREQHKIY